MITKRVEAIANRARSELRRIQILLTAPVKDGKCEGCKIRPCACHKPVWGYTYSIISELKPDNVDQFGFVLKDVKRLPFAPCKGALGLFDCPPEVLRQVQIREAAETGAFV